VAGLLEGEVALITGGASGLGYAIAKRFLDEGAEVAIFDRSAAGSAAAAESLGARVVTLVGDVRCYADNVAAVERTVAAFGRLSIFVGNAGIYDAGIGLSQINGEQLSSAFDELFNINLTGYMLGTKASLEELRKNRGNVIFTSSVSGMFAGFGGPLYISAKHALTGLTRQLALELAPEIRVNAVAPGYIPTNLNGLETLGQGRSAASLNNPERFLLKSAPTAADYTSVYALLASRSSSAILTGTVVLADGGASL
jgi:NAD(P)-dependent dehydrogenase (short-subunit alcohol dehydrogenase family)